MADLEPVLDIAVIEHRMETSGTGAAGLKIENDFYRYYRDTGVIIAPGQNDNLPDGARVVLGKSYFANVEPLGDDLQFRVTGGTPGKKINIGYTALDADGSELGRGRVTLLPMSGTPGVGGFRLPQVWASAGEDDGVLKINLAQVLAPQAGAEPAEVTRIRALADGSIPTRLEGMQAWVALAPFAYLDEGETVKVWFDMATEGPEGEVITALTLRVFGADDPSLTLRDADADGLMRGGRGNDTLISRAGKPDVMTGGPGDDAFVIPDYADDVPDRDTITDFLPGRDSLRFDGPEVQVRSVRPVDGGVLLETYPGDQLTLLGPGVTISAFIGTNVDMTDRATAADGHSGETRPGGDEGWDLVNTITIMNIQMPAGEFFGFGLPH